MKQIIENLRTGELQLVDVPIPICKPGGVLVKTAFSLISVGTEKSIIDLAKKSLLGKAIARPDLVKRAIEKSRKEGFVKVFRESLNRLDEPFPLGYSASGVVVETGEGVTEFKVGDIVSINGSGYANHAEYNWIPRNLCIRLDNFSSDSVPPEHLAFGMLGGIALQGVRDLDARVGETIAVIGLGLIGVLSLQILQAAGCKTIGIDNDANKIDKLRNLKLGEIVRTDEQLEEYVLGKTAGNGVDSVVICAATKSNEPIDVAQKISRVRGKIILVGVSGTHIDRKYFWDKELEFKVSRAAGPGVGDYQYEELGIDYPLQFVRWSQKRNIEAFLCLVSSKKIDIDMLLTKRVKLSEALITYQELLNEASSDLGVVIEYPAGTDTLYSNQNDRRINLDSHQRTSSRNSVNIGIIGSGNFTKNILAPAISKVQPGSIAAFSCTSGLRSRHLSAKYNSVYATSNYVEILEDENIDTVVITTRHDTHSQFLLESLRAGKRVFLEKPLCRTADELKQIAQFLRGSGSHELMLGFNRRHSPHAQEVKRFFKNTSEPKVINIVINAGYLEKDHWSVDAGIGGGRIVGEMCHFVDLMQYLTSALINKVQAFSIHGSSRHSPDQNLSSILNFADGSVGTITYTSMGNKSYPREHITVLSQDKIYAIEDFKRASFSTATSKGKYNLSSQDMGYMNEIEYFLGGGVSDVSTILNSSAVTFAMIESLQSGNSIDLSTRSKELSV